MKKYNLTMEDKNSSFFKMEKEYLKRLDEHYEKMPVSCKLCVNTNHTDSMCDTCEHKTSRNRWVQEFEYQEDKLIFKNTKYADMDFVRLSNWDNYDSSFASSPVFEFKNGDKVYFDKYGVLNTL